MRLDKDISGCRLFLDDMDNLSVISQTGDNLESPVLVLLSEANGNNLLEESYFFDFEGKINLSFNEILAERFLMDAPEIGTEKLIDTLCLNLKLDIGDGAVSCEFTVLGMSGGVRSKLSDIDIIRIPRNYVLPLYVPDAVSRSGVTLVTPYERYSIPDWLVSDGGGKGSIVRLVDISCFPDRILRSFHVEIDGTGLSTPQFKLGMSGCEQYLFANRYGGYDNLALDGDCVYESESEHENGNYRNGAIPVRSVLTDSWTQKSGYVSRQVIYAMRELVSSRYIYHLDKGIFRRIVITESEISENSSDNLHSFSFKYKYSETTWN